MKLAAEERAQALARGAVALAVLPALVGFFAAFAPTERGPWIAATCAVPLLLVWPWTRLRLKGTDYSRAAGFFMFPAATIATSLAFISVPAAYLSAGDATLWKIWIIQALAALLGLLAGVARHDIQAMRLRLDQRFRVDGSIILENPDAQNLFRMKAASDSRLIDAMVRIGYWIYAPLVVIGLFLGGGAPLILLAVFDPLLGTGSAMDTHAWAITILGFIVLPPAWYALPMILRVWRAVHRMERQAGPGQHWQDMPDNRKAAKSAP